MSIIYRHGDILKASVDAIVCPVNTVGVMGAGLAKQVRDLYPEGYHAYRAACKDRDIAIGRSYVHMRGGDQPYHIVYLPTKADWRSNARYEYVSLGLANLRDVAASYRIKSLAIPALGCGLGGLSWLVVRELIRDVTLYCPVLSASEVYVYLPGSK